MSISLVRSITCPHCGEVESIDLEPYCESDVIDEREMGAEIEHSFEVEEWQCENCKGKYNLRGKIWEYPEGAYNDEEIGEPEPIEDETEEE